MESSTVHQSLRERLDRDYVESLKARDSSRVSVIRMVRASVQNAEKSKGSELSEDELAGVIAREVKTRRESLQEFERGGRPDLVQPEANALEILAEYQPPQLSNHEIQEVVQRAISNLDPQALENPKSAFGTVMRAVMPELRDRADGAAVTEIVRATLEAHAP